MNKKGMNILSVFVLIIIGATLLVVLANTVQENITPSLDTNVSVFMRNGTSTSLGQDELIEGSLIIINATSNTEIQLGNFTVDYEAGTWYMSVISDIGNNTKANVTYQYESDNYIEDATSRVIAKQYTLFFVMAILLFIIGAVWIKYGKELMDM